VEVLGFGGARCKEACVPNVHILSPSNRHSFEVVFCLVDGEKRGRGDPTAVVEE